MNTTLQNVLYYAFALTVILGTGYVVFGLHESPWWFALAFVLVKGTPMQIVFHVDEKSKGSTDSKEAEK